MRHRRIASLCLLSAGLLAPVAVTGCVTSGGVAVEADLPPSDVIWVDVPPPPPEEEVVVAAPGPGYIWINGYWTWRGQRYVWTPGRWERPPRPSAHWQKGEWGKYKGRWYFREGRWRD